MSYDEEKEIDLLIEMLELFENLRMYDLFKNMYNKEKEVVDHEYISFENWLKSKNFTEDCIKIFMKYE